MKKNPLVSVIIPVYNGEKFIDKCVDSVLNQTYKNIEIILSNDGSTDNSLNIIKKYAKKYSNIKYDSHDNAGLSITRNIAFQNVSGDYVTYLDVDDYLDLDFVENMLKDNADYDIIIGGYRSVSEDGKIFFNYSIDNSVWGRYRRVTVWAKLYKVSFLKKNKIVYPDIRIFGEDVVYTMRCMSKTNNVIIKSYIGYNNLVNADSITHKENYKIINDVPKMIENVDNFISKDNNYLEKNQNIVKFYYFKILAAYLMELSYFTAYKELKDYYLDNKKTIFNIYKKYNYSSRIKWMKNEKFGVNLLVKLLLISNWLHLDSAFLKIISLKNYKRN